MLILGIIYLTLQRQVYNPQLNSSSMEFVTTLRSASKFSRLMESPAMLSETVRLEPPKAVFASYDEIVRRARMQLRNRLNEMMLAVDAHLLKPR